MPLTVQYSEGDGVHDDLLQLQILVPDSGNSYVVAGNVQPVGGTAQPVASQTVTGPGAPASGTNYFNIQVDVTTGTATANTSTTGAPALINSNNRIVFSQQFVAGQTVDSQVPNVTPDPPVGSP